MRGNLHSTTFLPSQMSETRHVVRIVDKEAGDHRRHPQFFPPSACLSDSEDKQSWHSPLQSAAEGRPCDKCGFSRIGGVSVSDPHSHSHSDSSFSDCLSETEEEVDLEKGVIGTSTKVSLVEAERECRICKLSLEGASQESAVSIHLGCCCKGDLGTAHKLCAQTWFQSKGNTICEICGATAINVAGEHIAEAQNARTASTASAEPGNAAESQCFWRSQRFMNILLACVVFGFVISGLFHSHAF